jgi:hypothetical protein
VTYPVIAQPDVEKWVVQQLEPLGSTVTCFCLAAVQLGLPGWLWSYTIQVDARAGRKAAARNLAESARQVMSGLTSVPWPDGVVSYVKAEAGPFWLPDVDGGPRYCARYEVRAHPSRDAWRPAPLKPRPATARPAIPVTKG